MFIQSALQLTEVLKERDAQLELKRLRAAAGKDVDAQYKAIEQQEYEKGVLRDQQEAAERMQKARQNIGFVKAQ